MKIKTNIVISLLVLAIVVLAFAMLYNKTPSAQNTISASGTSTLTVTPDRATVYLSIDTLKSTAEESKDENAKLSNAVLAALLTLLDKKDIETSSYNIYPEYDWSSGKQKLLGYKTSNLLKVKTSNFDDVGKIVDLAVNAGATSINSINFELTEEKQASYKKEALTKASSDAREKAEAIASGLNVKLGKIVSIQENDYYYRPYPLYTKGGSDISLEQAVSTDIAPSNLEVTASVSVVYSVK